MPKNINYNDLFASINTEQDSIVVKENKDNNLSFDAFFEQVNSKEKKTETPKLNTSSNSTNQFLINQNNQNKANNDLLFFDGKERVLDEEESLMLTKDIEDMDKIKAENKAKALVDRKQSEELSLNERLRNTGIFQQTLITQMNK